MAKNILNWDRFSLKINEQRVFLVGGEFHYWRVPDRERWRDVLQAYKTAGLNAVRIYFHWGFHNPAPDVFHFEGNRDVDYLLQLCEEIGLYVLVAAGPYICAETNAGGYPTWLVADRGVRLKHLKGTLRQKYDPKYMQACRAWFEQILARVRDHQITENPDGCVVAFQIENEYSERIAVIRGKRRYMQELIDITRENGLTVPTFHNDAWEAGSWNGLVNLYGFDKYVINMVLPAKRLPLSDWNASKFDKKVKNLESTVLSFGPPASETPMFIPELQGGWYNHWGVPYGFDELYDWYGPAYQKLVVESAAAQRVTMFSLYMFYGGTSWGAIPDPEVYTSYDYSACLREYGFQSGRLRYLRLFALFARSFASRLACTDRVLDPTLLCDAKDFFNLQRRSLDGTDFYFFRNFSKIKMESFGVQQGEDLHVPKEGVHALPRRHSCVFVGNLTLPGFSIRLCTLPIVLKGPYAGGTLLVVVQNGGELIFTTPGLVAEGALTLTPEPGFTRGRFPAEGGFAKVTTPDGEVLYLACVDEETALTLNADLDHDELRLAWGPYAVFFTRAGTLEVETLGGQDIFLLSPAGTPAPEIFEAREEVVPGLYHARLKGADIPPAAQWGQWEAIHTTWTAEEHAEIWLPIKYKTERDPLDHGFTSGHVLYKCEFTPAEGAKLTLKLNTRHKCALWVNDQFVGGHDNFHYMPFKTGAMIGPDPTFRGAQKYSLEGFARPGQRNKLLLLTESLGQNKNFWMIADARNPRGLLSAKLPKKTKDVRWFIHGVDVRKRDDPYDTAGFPGEAQWRAGEGNAWQPVDGEALHLAPADQIAWFKNTFEWTPVPETRVPLRLHLDGPHNVNVYLNGHYIGRYWGEAGPQHDFYLMDEFVRPGANTIVLACWTRAEGVLEARVAPYKVDPASGNLDEDRGVVFITRKYAFPRQV